MIFTGGKYYFDYDLLDYILLYTSLHKSIHYIVFHFNEILQVVYII